MATPLAQLVHDVMHDADVRSQFAAAPESFLAEHGHEHLDAADLREAFFVLADGSAPAEAAALQSGGRAMGGDDLDGGSAASGLAGALSAILGTVFDIELGADPTDLDDLDDHDDHDDPAGTDDADPSDDQRDLDGLDDMDQPESERQASRTAAESDRPLADADDAGGTRTGTDRAILYADDVDQPVDQPVDQSGSSLGGAAGAGVDAGAEAGADPDVDVLRGLPELDRAPLFEDSPLRSTEPILDEGDGWDDVI